MCCVHVQVMISVAKHEYRFEVWLLHLLMSYKLSMLVYFVL